MTLLEGMRISDKDLGGKKRENCQLTNLQLFQIILILPFMAVPGFSHYAGSSISKLFGGKKEILGEKSVSLHRFCYMLLLDAYFRFCNM